MRWPNCLIGKAMSARAVWDIFWHLVIVDGWSVLWRTTLTTCVFGALGILAAVLCYKLLFRGQHLKLDWKHEHFYEWLIAGLWVLGMPVVGVALGILLGGWWSGGFLIKTEKLGERIGLVTFKVVAAGVASANFKGTDTEKAQMAKAYLSGEQRITITELHTYSSHHAGELSAESLCQLLSTSSESSLHGTTVWAVEKTLDTVAYMELGEGGDILYKLATKVSEHDRTTDNDGQVTVEEISEVACKNFLDRSVGRLWTGFMMQAIVPALLVFLLLPILPVFLAWLTRRLRAWWLARKAAGESESDRDS